MRLTTMLYIHTVTLFYTVLRGTASHAGQQTAVVNIVGIDRRQQCLVDTDCSHGLCNKISRTCSCDMGWTGRKCNEPITYKSGPAAETSSELKPTIDQEQREQINSYLIDMFKRLGKRPRSRNHPIVVTKHRKASKPIRQRIAVKAKKPVVRPISKPTSSSTSSSASSTEKIQRIPKKPSVAKRPYSSRTPAKLPRLLAMAAQNEESNACSGQYRYRSMKERTCSIGLVCKYGSCASSNHGSYLAFDCKCDQGAQGLLCEKKCCLDCGQNGRCALFSNTQVCNCRRGYYGTRCEFSYNKMLEKDHIPIHTTSMSLQQQQL